MNDPVMIDLKKQLDREENWDSFNDRVNEVAEEIRQDYLSDPHKFSEITENIYHANNNWPIEECVIAMIRYQYDLPLLLVDDAMAKLVSLFDNELNRHCKNLAFNQIKKEIY